MNPSAYYPYFPRKITFDATLDHAGDYCRENFKEFFTFLAQEHLSVVDQFLDRSEKDFTAFFLRHYAGGDA